MPFHKAWQNRLFHRDEEEEGDDIEFEDEAPEFTTVARQLPTAAEHARIAKLDEERIAKEKEVDRQQQAHAAWVGGVESGIADTIETLRGTSLANAPPGANVVSTAIAKLLSVQALMRKK